MPEPRSAKLRTACLLLGVAVAAVAGLGLVAAGESTPAAWTAAITALCAIWWTTEPIPIPATALIPIAVFPLVGVMSAKQVGGAYGDQMILLLMGGSMLSTALERSGAHRRIALRMVRLVGRDSTLRLVLGFMVASAALSMWISNVATALMMLPIAIAAVEGTADRRVGVAMMLGIAYAASIGGIGTPVGTPPNLIFMEAYHAATGREASFLSWMSDALPIVAMMTPLAAWWLSRGLPKRLALELPEPGPWRPEEVRTLTVFAVTALLWITRTEPYGGWREWLRLPEASDASVALLAVVTMFVIPNGRGGRLLDWETAGSIPWGVILLFSSGIVIAEAFASSGLSAAIGGSLGRWATLPLPLLIGAICLVVTFLTEVTSNTAIASLLMPILAAVAVGAGLEPRLLMAPAAISASFAFMLPVATPPNAIVFGSGRVTLAEMARAGFVLNLLGAAIVTLAFSIFGAS
ncbi:MAG: SLC13/DASS family transporter [Pirellulales bacterium]|nr:SLC13/DASS family transporter [Pirellulales bacterium]